MNTPDKNQLPAQTDTKGSASITDQQNKSSDNLLSKSEQPASSATHQIDSVHTPGVISTYILEQDEQQSKPADQQPDPIYSPRFTVEKSTNPNKTSTDINTSTPTTDKHPHGGARPKAPLYFTSDPRPADE